MAEALITVEVAWAQPERQALIEVQVPAGTSVFAAVEASGILQVCPDIPWPGCPLGIFAERVADPSVRPVQAGDRIELYRPLLADPMQVRRERAARAAEAKKARLRSGGA
ncbi:RnfH family protein [Pseudomonas sp. nanlin1]|uniref:RnfH family protein n=1 Tax=Pseudomonas sp. nanlin1 TaxID=3040605 RepID=UPI00388F6A40